MSYVMLHVNNVCWLGGTMLFTHDVCKVYPEFKHYVLYFNNVEDKTVMQNMMNDGISMRCVPELKREFVEKIDPCVIWFNNTPDKAVEGEWPYNWLKRWTLIAVHHNPTWPLFDAELDIFNSENVKEKYKGCMSRIKKWKIIPPCIDTKRFSNIEKEKHDKIVIGKLANDNPKKFPMDLIKIFKTLDEKYPGKLRFSIVGGRKYYGDILPLDDYELIEFGEYPVEELYKRYDILVYKNCDDLTDTWARVITEAMASGLLVVADNRGGPAEQIEHSRHGFLCDSNEDFITYLSHLIELGEIIKLDHIKEKAQEYDIKRLRDETIDIVLEAAIGVA